MTIAARSRRAVEDHLDGLRAEYGEFRVVEREFPVSAADYERTVERFEAGTVGGAGAWVTDADGRVLLVRDRGPDGPWSEPSGKVEPGESLEAAACREVLEETGVVAAIEGLALAQHWRVRPAGDESEDDSDRGPVHRLVVVFDAAYVEGTARPREDDVADVRWWSVHPDDLLYGELESLPMPGDGG